MADESKSEKLLKRVQITLAIAGGIATVLVGWHNVKNIFFSGKNEPGAIVVSVSADGRALGGARVELLNSSNRIVNADETNPDGRYEREGLPGGAYSIKVSKSGFEPNLVTAEVGGKRTTELNLELRRVGGGAAPRGGLQSALEEAGASWIKKTLTPKEKADQQAVAAQS